MLITLDVHTSVTAELIDITSQVQGVVAASRTASGVCIVTLPHTTAGLTLNENWDPAVRRDILVALDGLVPLVADYTHGEGNSAAHVKALLTGSSLTIPIAGERLVLGTWQGIFLCEFDGPRRRRVQVSLLSAE